MIRLLRALALSAMSLLFAGAGLATPAPRLGLAAWPLGSREGEALFASALRVPGDSVALAAALAHAEARLQGAGWLDARLSAVWSADGAALDVNVVPGVRYRWGALSCDVPREDSLLLARLLHWSRGAPVDPAVLESGVDQALREAEDQGHAWAQLAVTGWDADSGRVNVRLSGALGPRVEVSRVRIDGLKTTRHDVAERALGRLAGLPYNPASARAAAVRLQQLGVFSRTEFSGLEGGPQWQAGTLAFKVQEPRYNRFEGAVGVQPQAGVVGLATLELGNLLGTARSAALGWQSRGAGRSDFSVRYVEPFLAGLPFRLEGALVQQLQDSTYTRTRWGARLGHALGTGDRIEAGLEEERVVQTRGTARTADLQNTVFAYERDGRDDLVAPRRGTRLRLSGTGVFKRETLRAPLPGESGSHRSRAGVVDARAEWHRPTGAMTGIALELWGTGRFASDRILADYERTPVGGATTLRGHDEEAFRADRVALSRLEYRWFPGGAGEQVSLFWDHAHLFTRAPVLDALGAVVGDRGVNRDADGVGLGLRLRAAGGLVDVDYGLEPGRGFLEGRIHLRLVSVF
ncbi:MAG TPA: BamA/TamA family outer membrane protein [Candidatus Eisenbacteria bacterium]|jgi:outer membrane protein assembly factor BamA